MPEQPQSSFRIGSTPEWRARLRTRLRATKRSHLASVAAAVLALITALVILGRAPALPKGDVLVEIPAGATFREVVDTLEARQVIARPLLFHIYARIRRLDRSVKAGTYRLARGTRSSDLLAILSEGRVVTHRITVPEGLTIKGMAKQIAAAAGSDSVTVADALSGDSVHLAWDVPGPGLEGYLFPDTYYFAEGVGVERVVSAMVAAYRRYWTPERRRQLAATGLSEREAVTLASIIQAEAGRVTEMRTISSVYHNRLRIGMLLQADPTVLYALGGHRPRLLYAAIDSVADHPFNTYAHAGLPPGPICAPGAAALDAALDPEDTDYLFFVARATGEHVFTRSLREHNAARAQLRRESGRTG